MEEELGALRKLASSLAKRPPDALDLAAEGVMRLLGLKEACKRQCLRVEELKEQTSQAKHGLESSDLELQNLLYEKQYYEKEIFTCRRCASSTGGQICPDR
jgi:THO complex subunit 5